MLLVNLIVYWLFQGFDPMDEHRRPRITDRQDEYKAMARKMIISPARFDPFELGKIWFWFASSK